jgi:hypothetical protein
VKAYLGVRKRRLSCADSQSRPVRHRVRTCHTPYSKIQ